MEVGQLLNHIDYTINHLPEWLKKESVSPANPAAIPCTMEIIYEPKGIVLIVEPWNVLLSLTLYPLISVIAGGNTCISKPSELTLHHSALLKNMITECFDEHEVAVVGGGVPETIELLKLPFVHIYFTGSPKDTKVVMRATAENLSSITLELGEKALAVIHESTDLDKAIFHIIKGKALNAGQICMDTDYALIPESLKNGVHPKSGCLS